MTQYPYQQQQAAPQQPTSWGIGGEGGNSFPFDAIGDYVAGLVLNVEEVQQTDPKDGTPQTWDNGDPKMQYRVTLQTELRDPNNPADDGKRTIYLRGSKKPADDGKSSLCAVLDAVREVTGGTDLQYRGHLTLQYVGDGRQTNRAFNPPKRWASWYQAPAMSLGTPGANVTTPPAQQPPASPPQQQYTPPTQPAAPPNAGPAASAPPSQPPAQPAPQQVPPPPVNPVTGEIQSYPGQPTAEQVAGLQALGIDPRTVYPNWQG